MRQLKGETALVTGASRGIGRAIACALAGKGVRIVAAARSQERLREVCDTINGSGGRADWICADLAERAQIESLAAESARRFGPISILVNNAAAAGIHSFEKSDLETVERELRVDLAAPIFLTRLLLPSMLERGAGHVVNISSMGGRIALPGLASYSAAKAGLISFTEALRSEFGDRGVSASVILPGIVRDDGMAYAFSKTTGFAFPRSAGGCTTGQVARATVRAIEKDSPEKIVNWPPLRPSLAHMILFPRTRERILRAIGVFRMCRQAADMSDKAADKAEREGCAH